MDELLSLLIIFMKKISFLITSFAYFIFSGTRVLAQSFGLDETAGAVDAYKGQDSSGFNQAFVANKVGDIIGLVLSFVGVIFLILIIYGGISWMFSAGNEQKVEKAKSIIINAVIGLVIVFAAYTITSFIGNQFVN